VKHILLHISGSWPIRVRFLHSWATVLPSPFALPFIIALASPCGGISSCVGFSSCVGSSASRFTLTRETHSERVRYKIASTECIASLLATCFHNVFFSTPFFSIFTTLSIDKYQMGSLKCSICIGKRAPTAPAKRSCFAATRHYFYSKDS